MSEHIDISQWSVSEKMMLPDHAYGARNVATISREVGINTNEFHPFTIKFPDEMIIWGIKGAHESGSAMEGVIILAVADVLPTAAPAFKEHEQIGRGSGTESGRGAQFFCDTFTATMMTGLKQYVQPQGRRLFVRFTNRNTQAQKMEVVIVWSGIPRSIPRWILGLNNGGI
ncbi:MAG: hypothetical protein IID32_05480 [Planctomycetes bacterium]|nr:hypothetical protein [Planctomycetota bacterium]